jgi:hypothetical protein
LEEGFSFSSERFPQKSHGHALLFFHFFAFGKVNPSFDTGLSLIICLSKKSTQAAKGLLKKIEELDSNKCPLGCL